MWKKMGALCCLFLLLFTLNSCSSEEKAEESEIGNEEEASQAINDVSEDVSDLSDSLTDISEDLG